LALYQLSISSSWISSDPPRQVRVKLGIGSSDDTTTALWSLDARGRVIRDVCPPLATTNTDENNNDNNTSNHRSYDLDNDGLQTGGIAGIILGIVVVGVLLSLWVRQHHHSDSPWFSWNWCCCPFSSPSSSSTPVEHQDDGAKDPIRWDITHNSSSWNTIDCDSPDRRRKDTDVVEVTL